MKKAIWTGLAGVAVLLVGAGVQAQPIYATGENPPLDGWNPGGNVAYQLLDDGTGGDAATGDGILSRDITLTGSTASGWFIWKGAGAGWSPEAPANGVNANANSNAAVGGILKFVVDTNVQTDGFTPGKTGDYAFGIPYTVPGAMGSAGFIRATGDYVDGQPGAPDGPGDWDNSVTTTTLLDDGLNGDVLGDTFLSRSRGEERNGGA